MDWDRKSIRVGAMVIGSAVLLRLMCGGVGSWLTGALTSPEITSMMLFFETGHIVKNPVPIPTGETHAPQNVGSPEGATRDEEGVPVFSDADVGLVAVNNICGYETDIATQLRQPLSWDLTEEAPSVLIIHSHGSESYCEYADEDYRSGELGDNVVALGDRLVQILETGGVRAVHDRQLHDSPSYSASYSNARRSMESYLAQYPSIRLVLDIHRDAVEGQDGNQMKFVTQVNGMPTAQLMLVVGTDASGLSHPHWPENMSLAVKLHAQLERITPGICRPINFRSQRFNQDLSPGALIVEIGGAGNSLEEAMRGVEILGQAVLELARGTATVN